MRPTLPHLALCALAAVALALAGCGDSETPASEKIPADLSQDLLGEFEQIQARVDANVSGACDDIFEGVPGGNFDQVGSLVDSIPDSVSPEIRSALSDSVDRLQQLVNDQCTEIRAGEQDEETVPDETVPDETETTETETTPPETETTPPETETTPTPPDEDPGNGNGQGPDGEGPPGQDNGGGIEVPEL